MRKAVAATRTRAINVSVRLLMAISLEPPRPGSDGNPARRPLRRSRKRERCRNGSRCSGRSKVRQTRKSEKPGGAFPISSSERTAKPFRNSFGKTDVSAFWISIPYSLQTTYRDQRSQNYKRYNQTDLEWFSLQPAHQRPPPTVRSIDRPKSVSTQRRGLMTH